MNTLTTTLLSLAVGTLLGTVIGAKYFSSTTIQEQACSEVTFVDTPDVPKQVQIDTVTKELTEKYNKAVNKIAKLEKANEQIKPKKIKCPTSGYYSNDEFDTKRMQLLQRAVEEANR